MTRTEAYLVLNALRRVGPVRVRRLREALGAVEGLFGQGTARMAGVEGVGQAVAESIRGWEKDFDLASELKKIAQLKLQVVDCEDPLYPSLLREIHDPPLVLYYRGSLEAVRGACVGIVGTREATGYGIELAKKLGYQLAYAGVGVVSGLARGIDTAAHQGALAAKGRTAGVLGCSLDQIYPAENRSLAEKMEESGGCVMSEFCLGTTPDRQTFPMRNRIVSGLSKGVLVIEAARASGAMITAKQALEQGRQVFAVPGRIDHPQSGGCHQLLKEGARLVESVEDVLAEFEFLIPKSEMPAPTPPSGDLGPEERKVLDGLGREEMHLDVLTRKCGLPSPVVSATLLKLEIKRRVRQMPGKYFTRID
jgi:DNA processing protein